MGIGNFIPREVWLIEDAEVPDGIRDYVRGGGKNIHDRRTCEW